MMVEEMKHQDILCQRIFCPDFDADLAVVSLETYHQVQNGVGRGGMRETPPPSALTPDV